MGGQADRRGRVAHRIVHPFVNHLDPANQTRNGEHKRGPEETRQDGAARVADPPGRVREREEKPCVPVIVELLDPVHDEHEPQARRADGE